MNEIQFYAMEESAALAQCHENLMAALKEHDSGRWDWDKIDVCLTWKDADLEPHGQQGIELVSITEDEVFFKVHGGKTIPGWDISLNFPSDLDESDYDTWNKYREIYLEQAREIVCGAGSDGYWSGDDWFLSFEDSGSIEWQFDDKGEMSYELTAQAVVAKANELLAHWEAEMILADKMIDQLAGWRDSEGNRCDVGNPDMNCSVFSPFYQGDEE